ncbi:MAG: sugar ABC transporter ATP-binding protein [Armatimonadota bacterium]|nr:sugar ABC transporter ATP-binding protein [Armatimonadota bacterium]
MSGVFLRANHLSKRYGGVIALHQVDLTVEEGEVHGLVGENGSGKSTLVKIITGVVQPEAGAKIEMGGEHFRGLTPYSALRKGVQVVHQDLSLFPNLSVAENIAVVQHVAGGRRVVSWSTMRQMAVAAMRKIGVELDPDVPVGSLPVADQQLVAICRALASDARLLVMDEPTSALTRAEVDRLFGVIKELQSHGIAILFISHKLDEVLAISQRITVLRDGRKIGTLPRGEVDREKLVRLMTGKEIAYAKTPSRGHPGDAVLEVRGLSKRGNFADISFTLFRGEVLGIIGPLGSGRTELALSLFGMNPPEAGTVLVEGKPVTLAVNGDAIRHGIAYVPEDRLKQGLVINQSVGNNLILTALDRLRGRLGLLDRRRGRQFCDQAVAEFDIRLPSLDAPARTLSGGNQQKTVIAKWLSIKPRILILDGPTIGIDVGAKEMIYEIIRNLSGEGVSIILISDEVQEVLSNCGRILLMKHGRITREFANDDVSAEQLQQALVS